MGRDRVPLTVIGGYLGAGKTTVVNELLRRPGGRLLGVIVNDFGELAIDAEVLSGASPGAIVSLPNGCVCCTLGADLQQTLAAMADAERPPDQIVIEVSGVAEPAATAAWGTVPPYEPGGVIVLAAADTIRVQADDRYVGGEVRRQLAGADLVVVTKTDLVDGAAVADVEAWCRAMAGGAPVVRAERGALPADVLLGIRPDGIDPRAATTLRDPHADGYVRWSWTSPDVIGDDDFQAFLDALPAGVLRMKGWVLTTSGTCTVDVVGRRREVRPVVGTARPRSALVAIGHRDQLDPSLLTSALPGGESWGDPSAGTLTGG